MLPRAARLRGSNDFRHAVRRGVRAGRRTVVVHADHSPTRPGVRVGFVVSKAVGGAVARNRVKRRLRHLAVERLSGTPAGVDLVVRALPPAAHPRSDLAGDLGGAWDQAVSALGRRPRTRDPAELRAR